MMSLIYGGVFTFLSVQKYVGNYISRDHSVSLAFSTAFLVRAGITFQKGTIRYFAGILLLG